MKKIGTYALWLLIAIISAFFSYQKGKTDGRRIVLGDADTVIRYKTVYRDSPAPLSETTVGRIKIPTYVFLTEQVHDTVTSVSVEHDTTYVVVPRAQRYYEGEDGRLRVWVSGYDPTLDRYELDDKESVIVPKRDKWNLSVSGGAGISPKGVVPFVGFTVGRTIFSW